MGKKISKGSSSLLKAEILPQNSHFATPQKTRKNTSIFPWVIFNGCLIVFNVSSAKPPSPALASRCPSALQDRRFLSCAAHSTPSVNVFIRWYYWWQYSDTAIALWWCWMCVLPEHGHSAGLSLWFNFSVSHPASCLALPLPQNTSTSHPKGLMLWK